MLVLDIMPPGLDGLALLSRLRERGDKTPTLMLTARDTVEDRVEGLNAGADDYLVKPFAFPELLARVRALAAPASPGGGERTPEVGELEMDTTTREVRRNGLLIELKSA